MNWFKHLLSRFKRKPKPSQLSERDRATRDGKPYVNVTAVTIDPSDPSFGNFELEWNDLFIENLIKAGYRGRTNEQIVDQWFESVCRNIGNQEFAQFTADPENRMISRRSLGGGRYEAS